MKADKGNILWPIFTSLYGPDSEYLTSFEMERSALQVNCYSQDL